MSGEGEQDSRVNGPLKPFFSGGGEDSTASYANTDVAVGTEVGPFKVCGILGEGGYGIVYLAKQEQPIRRRVALKVIKPGMDSRQVIARFEAERQALAMLDHPNIAQIYDAGTTHAGRPYFAMEYIAGLPITEYCDRERLDLKERLRLFLQVCDAVQHAHQKGIIHRDLKPSNILVAAGDGKPLIKVIDFGIAKALSQPLTDRTLYTEQGQFIGTLDYMSPEQAGMDAGSLDTRSDVYSLGVVLYELLTGVLPFDPDVLRAGGIEHVQATIREQEVPTPSTRLTSLDEKTGRIAEQRRTDPQTLSKLLLRELEWIPLKAMRKEPDRRYQSASDLAGDIENYLHGRPLLAGPESVTYRAKKFVLRHSLSIGAAAAILLVIVLGFVVSTVMYFAAERAREQAVEAQAAEQNQRHLAERISTEAEKRLADLYMAQGRSHLASGEYDKALVFLSEAYKIDGIRPSLRLALLEGLRKHGDPNFRRINPPLPWQGFRADEELPFCVSPSRSLVAFVDERSHGIYVQRTDTGKRFARLAASRVLNLAFTPDDRRLIAKVHRNPERHLLQVFDVQTAREVTSIDRRNVDIDWVRELAGEHPPERLQLDATHNGVLISPKADWFAFVDVGDAIEDLAPRICLWDFETHTLRAGKEAFQGHVLIGLGCRTPSAYGHKECLLVLDRERVVHFFSVPDLEFEGNYPFGATSCIFSADGTRFIAFAEELGAALFDRSGNRLVRRLPGTDRYGFSPDGRYAVTKRTGGLEAGIDIWDARDGRHVAALEDPEIEDLYCAPDSGHLVTAHEGGRIRIWSLRNFVSTFEIPATEDQIVTDLSEDGLWLLTRRRDDAGPIRLYDLSTGRFFEPYECRTTRRNLNNGWAPMIQGPVFSCIRASPRQLPLFNQDGSRVITGDGLLSVYGDETQFHTVPALVAACISLRLEAGNLRPASPEEMLRAKAESARLLKGLHAPETTQYLLQIAEQERVRGNLDGALGVAMSVPPFVSSPDPSAASSVGELRWRLAEDFRLRGELAARQGRYESALQDCRIAVSLSEDNPRAHNALAWLLATCPDVALRNGWEAIEHAERACALTQGTHWEYVATYAAACAAEGNWADAVAHQEQALGLLPEDEHAKWLANYEERWRRYLADHRYERREFLDFLGYDLVARWDFEDTGGTPILPGSTTGWPVRLNWDVKSLASPRGHILRFAANTGYADCGPLQLPEPIGAITVSAWGKWDGPRGEDVSTTLVSWGHSWLLFHNRETGTLTFQCAGLNVPVNAPHSRVVGQTPLLHDGKWRHFAGAYDGASLRVYIDGVLDAKTDATGVIPAFKGYIWVGMGRSDSTSWHGMIDDVRVYAVALSAEEISGLYERGRSRYEGLFFVDAGDTRTITLPANTVSVQAVVTDNHGPIPPDGLGFSWRMSRGPASVEFAPSRTVANPSVTFFAPGVYELTCMVEKDGLKAHDSVPIIVYPQGFDGLVAHYTFDCGAAADHSGHGIDGKLRGDARVVNDAERGNVLRLGGDGGYVDCGTDVRLDVDEVVTVAAWIKVASFDREHQAIVTKGDSAWALYRNRQTDRVRFVCGGMDGFESWPGPIGATPVNDGRWHHVTGVCDGTHMILYIDGRADASVKASGKIRVNGQPVYIGENAEITGRSWNGWIDDVRIYNRALSAAEIARLFQKTK
jgi:serine/threonine protein kinase/WD40 repeat protein